MKSIFLSDSDEEAIVEFVKQHEELYDKTNDSFKDKQNSNSNSNWTFIALNLPKQEDSKAQQNKKQSTKFCVQGHNRGRTPRRTPGG